MYTPSKRKLLVGVLAVCFFVQTGLVYSDQREAPLSEEAVRGRKLYHENACQVCHQLYGQGGFLGPDLTNVSTGLDSMRLRSLLTVGSGQMPALSFSDAQITDMRAFLREIDRPDLGRGQLRLGSKEEGGGPQAAFEQVVLAALTDASEEAEGFAALAARPCSQCHVPFQTSIVGAPDLSEVVGRLSLEELRSVLAQGRPEVGMPPPVPPFSPSELESVLAYLVWLAKGRTALEAEAAAAGARDTRWGSLPWWEFR